MNIKKRVKKKNGYNWLPDFVYGGIDGAVTTFAVVAGVEGASLSIPVILILGFANLFADGFSMATSKYLSDKTNQEQYARIRAREKKHIQTNIKHKDEELDRIISSYGFKGKDLTSAKRVFQSNPDALVDLIMRNEYNMTQENINPKKGGIATFTSFLIIGFIPLIVYVFRPLLPLDPEQTFIATAVATLAALFIVGAIKSRFTDRHWTVSGMETALIGGIAATIAYVVGYFLKDLAG